MRIAILSDIHGNRTAFEAVLRDLRDTAPDLVLHGGDLADSGSDLPAVVDEIRALGWQGVAGNTDEMLFRPESLGEFAGAPPGLKTVFDAVEEIASNARATLGSDRIEWLAALPNQYTSPPIALVHASPGSLWRAPSKQSPDNELQDAYGSLGQPVVIYGHIHQPFVRHLEGFTVANSGSVGLPYDGDTRASYLLIDGAEPMIRRVEYDVEREVRAVADARIPHADWIARMLRTAAPQMP